MKHAYLIMAHNNPKVLNVLLSMLDDARNDIYLHIDKKSTILDPLLIKDSVRAARLFFVKQMDNLWGEYSLVDCELRLIKAALKSKTEYSRIHLLSGVDLPIKTQDEIHDFFDKHKTEEFINIEDIETKEARERISWYLNETRASSFSKYYCKINNILIDRFKRFRNRKLKAVKTAQWFSVTPDLANYLWKKRGFIKRHFRYTDCPDENFLGTTLYGTKYWNNFSKLYGYENGNMSNMRLIDWKRGTGNSPYTFKSDDIGVILNSPMLFARKFSDENFDIVEAIGENIGGR